MSILNETQEVARRTMTLFFVVDTSGSMAGSKIGAVNDAIVNVLPMLEDISSSNPDAEVKVAALEFSTECSWLYDEPKLVQDFKWIDMTAKQLTSLGAACRELNQKLSRSHGFMNSPKGSYAPAIILLSDGEPTDDYAGGLAELKNNNWFKAAIKVAIAIGDDANKEELAKFTGTNEGVFTVHNIDALKQIIRIVAVTTTQIATNPSGVGSTKQETVLGQVKGSIADVKGAEVASEPSSLIDYDEW